MAKKKYFVADPLRHDGEDFPVGSTITLEPSQAEALLKAGVLSSVAPETVAPEDAE